jgi:hypothetical protein
MKPFGQRRTDNLRIYATRISQQTLCKYSPLGAHRPCCFRLRYVINSDLRLGAQFRRPEHRS